MPPLPRAVHPSHARPYAACSSTGGHTPFERAFRRFFDELLTIQRHCHPVLGELALLLNKIVSRVDVAGSCSQK